MGQRGEIPAIVPSAMARRAGRHRPCPRRPPSRPRLMQAKAPVAITTYLGRNPKRPLPCWSALALACGIADRASLNSIDLCVSAHSPCFAGLIRCACCSGLMSDCCWMRMCLCCPKPGASRSLNPLDPDLDMDAVKTDFRCRGLDFDIEHQGWMRDRALAEVLGRSNALRVSDPGFWRRVVPVARMEALPARRRKCGACCRYKPGPADPGETDQLSAAYLFATLTARCRRTTSSLTKASATRRWCRTIFAGRGREVVCLAGGGLGFSGGMALGRGWRAPGGASCRSWAMAAFISLRRHRSSLSPSNIKLPIFTLCLTMAAGRL